MKIDEAHWQGQQFERHRPHLQAVAYRMLGSMSEAEDAVQEAWLKLSATDVDAIDNVVGWLTVVVGRVCVDMLRRRRSRNEEYVGTWLPEPVVQVDGGDPEKETLMADSVGIALLVVLEALKPAERVAFVLHDMFAVPFGDIATILERSPDAVRQLASRARQRVRGTLPEPDPDIARQREVVAAFLAASRAGNFDALLSILDPSIVFRADGGAARNLVRRRITGHREVARYAAAQGPRFASLCHPALVNGAAGLVIRTSRALTGAVGFTITDSRIATIDLILDPKKLTMVEDGSRETRP
jgi:RNA polymerase sigma-70 factor (ECF subfamily)